MKFKKINLLLLFLAVILVVLPAVSVFILYANQRSITQNALKTLNEQIVGEIKITDSHIAPFANFPYISIDLDGVSFYESKTSDSQLILSASDIYMGFSIRDIFSGNFKLVNIVPFLILT